MDSYCTEITNLILDDCLPELVDCSVEPRQVPVLVDVRVTVLVERRIVVIRRDEARSAGPALEVGAAEPHVVRLEGAASGEPPADGVGDVLHRAMGRRLTYSTGQRNHDSRRYCRTYGLNMPQYSLVALPDPRYHRHGES